MHSDGLTRLDTPAQKEVFRSEYYLPAYNLALGVTGAPDAARNLTDIALERAIRRFSGRPLPADCTPYLVAQVYLLFAQRETAKAPAAPVEEKPAEPSAAPVPAAPMEEKPAEPSAAPVPAAPVEEKPAEPFAAPAPAAPAQGGTAPAEPENLKAVYDSAMTEFWVPSVGEASPSGESSADSPVAEAWEEDLEPIAPDQPSMSLSVLNTLLVLVCVGSLVFLLIMLGAFSGTS